MITELEFAVSTLYNEKSKDQTNIFKPVKFPALFLSYRYFDLFELSRSSEKNEFRKSVNTILATRFEPS